MKKSVEEEALTFFDEVDMAGPFMPLEDLKKKIDSAPLEAREHDDFKYLIGLFVGRFKFEQKTSVSDLSADTMNIIFENKKIRNIGVSIKKIMSMPLAGLEDFIKCAPDATREHPEFGFLVGYLDGQLIITEYGGVDEEQTNGGYLTKMKKVFKKMAKWELPTLVVYAAIFYTAVSMSVLWIIIDFIALGEFGKNLHFISYVVFAICLMLTVVYAKKIFRHVVKIKRGGFEK